MICTFREPERNPEHDVERVIAGQVLIQAMRDYHSAKKYIQKNNIAFKYHCRKTLNFLSDHDREKILNGKEAWEWLTQEPLPNREGWTFGDCCEMLGLNEDETREKALSPSVHRRFQGLNVGAFKPMHQSRNRRGIKEAA